MSRILIIGGYGTFGARLSRRLAERGHAILVAGRDIAKATAFCAAHPGCDPVRADRERGIGMVMAQLRPDLVIDAAGPFQGGDRMVPDACVAMRIPYLDLADARDFVTGIGALDKEARAAGVAIVSGASSVPALSGAVVRHLAQGLARVDAVDLLIATSNRASAGESVARAILSYVGRPVRLWNGEAWTVRHGWQDMRRATIDVAGLKPLRRRLVALAEVPDLDLLPAMLPGRPAVTFRAGTELALQMRALWLLSWPVRWRWITSLAGIGRLLMPLYRLMLRFGGDRSAMQVVLRAGGLERRWSLIAEQGDGPEIPTMAAELLAEDILAGRVAPGARDASALLTLDRFEPLFASFAIRHEIRETSSILPGSASAADVRVPPKSKAA
ncbi:MAG: NAD-dependent epimerase/dehydratase family protein [Sphingomonas sp.]|uniref:saccharopine dehydrogenase family protein n=1 Tax=Sphingomonas sp. TaxID=28214 RepID=UPI003F7D3764